jgi:transposase
MKLLQFLLTTTIIATTILSSLSTTAVTPKITDKENKSIKCSFGNTNLPMTQGGIKSLNILDTSKTKLTNSQISVISSQIATLQSQIIQQETILKDLKKQGMQLDQNPIHKQFMERREVSKQLDKSIMSHHPGYNYLVTSNGKKGSQSRIAKIEFYEQGKSKPKFTLTESQIKPETQRLEAQNNVLDEKRRLLLNTPEGIKYHKQSGKIFDKQEDASYRKSQLQKQVKALESKLPNSNQIVAQDQRNAYFARCKSKVKSAPIQLTPRKVIYPV